MKDKNMATIVKKVGGFTLYDDGRFKLTGVVLAYPTLIKPKAILENPKPKYSVSILLDKEKHKDEIDALKDHIKKACTDRKIGKLPSDKVCLRDGEDLGNEAYEPYYRLTASANDGYAPVLRILGEKKDRREDAEELEEVCVSGAKASVLCSLYLQDNQYGKRANANIVAVNFLDETVAIELGGGAGDDDEMWEDDDDL